MTTTIDALRPEMLEDIIETFRGASKIQLDFVRVELPRHQWAQIAAALAQYATDYDRPLNQTERGQLEAFASKFAACAEQAKPVYMYQLSDGSWIEQTKASYEYNLRHSVATAPVRILYTTPPAAPAKLEPLTEAETELIWKHASDLPKTLKEAFTCGVVYSEAAHNAKLGGA